MPYLVWVILSLCPNLIALHASTPKLKTEKSTSVLQVAPANNTTTPVPSLLLNPFYTRGLNQRAGLIEKAKKFILEKKAYNQTDQIFIDISKDKNTMKFLAATRLSVNYSEAASVMDLPEQFGVWSMRNINFRPDGRKYFLEINQLNLMVPNHSLEAECTFQVLMLKLMGTIPYHFFYEKIPYGSNIFIKLKEVNQVITNMEGHFFTLRGTFLGRESAEDTSQEAYLIMTGEAEFLDLISPFLPLDLIKSEFLERLDRMMNNLYERIDELKLKPTVPAPTAKP